jgi:hypothetical protein
VKSANTVAALDNTPWWNGLMVATRYLPEVNGSVALNLPVGPFCVPPGRFLRLEVLLVPANGATPVVTSVCPRYAPTATCRPHPVCDENAQIDPASGRCVCNEGWVGDGLSCSPVCVTIAPASPDTTAYNSTSDPTLWTFGTIGDNYWCSGCGDYTRSYYVNVPSKRLLREARLLWVGFDDWVTIWVNGTRVWCGPNGQCWTGGQRCELSTSWQFGTNVDLSPYLNQGNNEIRVQTIVAGCGESWINVRLDSGGRCN